MNEGAYLLLKNYSKKGKYPPPLIIKHVPDWNFKDISKLFAPKQKRTQKSRMGEDSIKSTLN